MNFKKNIGQETAGFQMAPMVDIMFLLLIFFMVSSIYYQREKKLEVQLPHAKEGEYTPRSMGELIINVDKEGKYYVNNFKRDIEGVKEILDAVVARSGETQPVIIRCDKETPHKYFVKVFDTCQSLGIQDVRIAHMPEAKK